MFHLVGLGIGDELDISLRGVEACREASEVYAELYTARWQGSLKKLEKEIGKKITVLERKDVEEKSEKFVRKAKDKDIVLLVAGDPLTATTHLHLFTDAKKHGVPFHVVHSSSIFTAISETGLNLYNFGRIVTVVKPDKQYAPTSFYDYAVENNERGMHTLFLLDIDMSVPEGLGVLMGIEKQKKKGIVKPATKLVAATAIGTSRGSIVYDTAKKLLKEDLQPPAILILPGKLHFIEEEWLEEL